MAGPFEIGTGNTSRTVSVKAVAWLGIATIWLFLAGIVGAIDARNDTDDDGTVAAGTDDDSDDDGSSDDGGVPGTSSTTTPVTVVDPDTGEVVPVTTTTVAGATPTTAAGGGTPTTAAPGTPTTQAGGGTATTAPPTTAAPVQGDRRGVSDTTVKIYIHAPQSIDGAPLDLAEDPVKGIEGYTQFVNDNGGIHGRKLEVKIFDDRYTASGGSQAAKAMIEENPFIISGTLGVDQINVVAREANKAKIPYHAAGGGEDDFASLGIYQVGTSYDTHVIKLARFLATDEDYRGKKVGISALDSALIQSSVDNFKAEAQRVGVNVVETVYISKPTEQSSYSGEIQSLKDAGVEVFVPLQDPVSTSRMVQECRAALCEWDYTFSNFAHEGDTAYALFQESWAGTKGLAAACYYLHPNAYDPAKCARMDKAHAQWAAVYSEDDWQENGQGGSTGYQIVQMMFEAIRRVGPDPTREGYRAAIESYDAFDDLITSPITFAGKDRYSHGSDKMVVYVAEPGASFKYRQLSEGLTDF